MVACTLRAVLFFFKQKTAYAMRISDWSSDVCSSDLAVKDDILDQCQTTVRLEDAFIDLAFEMGPVPGMTPKEIKKYIRYIADWRLGQIGFKPIYMIDEHTLPWLAPPLHGAEIGIATWRERVCQSVSI